MIRSLSLAALLASPVVAFADPPAGQIDPTFNDGEFESGVQGLQIEGFDLGFSLDDLDDYAYAMKQDPQGRLILAGVAETSDGDCLGLMRFTSEGVLDTSDFGFNANQVAKGKICHSILASDSHLQPDLDITTLAEGGFLVSGFDAWHPYVCRFSADGTMMEAFGGGCVVISDINGAGIWPAPTLIIRGSSILVVTNHVNLIKIPVLARISLDTGASEPFGDKPIVPVLSGNYDAFAREAILTDDGDLVVVGRTQVDDGDDDAFIARFDLQDYEPDLAFSGDGMVRFKFNKIPDGTDSFQSVTLASKNVILAAGVVDIPGNKEGLAVVEVDAGTGAINSVFNDGLPKTYDPCAAFPGGCGSLLVSNVATAAGHIVVSGSAGSSMFAGRLALDGTIDKGFGQQGLARIDLGSNSESGGATDMVLQDERILLAGPAYNGSDTNFALLRLSDGRLFKDEFEVVAP